MNFSRGLGGLCHTCGNSEGVGGHQFPAKMENPGRWGGPKWNSLCSGGLDIFWNYTMWILLIVNLILTFVNPFLNIAVQFILGLIIFCIISNSASFVTTIACPKQQKIKFKPIAQLFYYFFANITKWKHLNKYIIKRMLNKKQKQKHTTASVSKLANNSFRYWTSCWAVHWDESIVNPSISANKILKTENRKQRDNQGCS